MPGFLIVQSASVACAHQGRATPGAVVATVTAGGSPVVVQPAPYSIAGCANPPASGGPCVTGTWTSGTTRVTAHHQPLGILAAPGICAPTGVPMVATTTQSRVRAT